MHPINKLLPEIERENIQKNDENNLQNILNTFEKVKNDKNVNISFFLSFFFIIYFISLFLSFFIYFSFSLFIYLDC